MVAWMGPTAGRREEGREGQREGEKDTAEKKMVGRYKYYIIIEI